MFNVCGDLAVAVVVSNKVDKDLAQKEAEKTPYGICLP